MTTRTQTFADALNTLDADGSAETLTGLFADGAELVRPELDHGSGDDPDSFWSQYRSQFADISTTFSRVEEEGSLGVLEWVSEGTLAAGRPITYAGVSLLTFDTDDRVSRFATYYDTAAFVAPDAS